MTLKQMTPSLHSASRLRLPIYRRGANATAGVLALALLIVPLSSATSAESQSELLGRISAYGSYCGLYGKVQALDTAFSDDAEYKVSKRNNDLSGADMVKGLNCAKLEQAIDSILAHPDLKNTSKKGPTSSSVKQVHCRLPGADATTRIAESDCTSRNGEVHAVRTEFKSERAPETPSVDSAGNTSGVQQKLEELQQLHVRGLITKAEYDAKRKELLDKAF